MIGCTNVGIEPSYDCYDMCVSARRCEALKAWEREKAKKEKKNRVIEEVPSAEPKTKCIAQIRIDRDDMEDLVNEKVNEIVNEIVDKIAKPKTGKWVKVIDQETPNVTKWHYECDQCGAGRFEKCQKYCSRCGARMVREDGE